ncbi:WD repeat-containing protein 3-like [Physella acuta]|uniref:WD repeat-containing protein 3-like n=1 Tax=Physella acuta TaxID=109671 RepID=UPI0027DC7925|nr:WD repeat-containing protein 3-like [Physella acuta]XP_059175701.1 WD repeat-containing protein 3-like [Physella acuta]
MGVTKQYLRVAPGPVFGLVASQKSNLVILAGEKNTLCAVGACENVYLWDLTTKQKVSTLTGDKHEVTWLVKSPIANHMAVGYMDGTIKIFNLDTCQCEVTFQGHKASVTSMTYDYSGMKLASGSKDTDVIVWDVVSESGLYRLKGHKMEITQVSFLKNREILVTSSKDTFIKFWDLRTQHCFYTVVGHTTEVYGFLLLRDETRLVSGSADSELRIWDIHYLDSEQEDENEPTAKRQRMEVDDAGSDEDNDEEKTEKEAMRILVCKKVGSVMRQGRTRLVTLCVDPQEKLLLCHGTDKNLEVFELPSKDDLLKLKAKKIKKLRKKHLESGQEVDTTNVTLKLEDEIKFVETFRFSSKLCSVHCTIEKNNHRFCVLFSNNKIETGVFSLQKHEVEMSSVTPLAQAGHRSDVRTLAFSTDNISILSASAEEVKIWNRDSLRCVHTLPCEYALCSLFVSGDRHAVIGTKSGKLFLFDINQGALLESIEAHSGALWSITAMPDKRGLISGGADHEVKFWNYELVSKNKDNVQQKLLTLEHTRTLKMDEDVLCVKVTPDYKMLAVSLLDSTVKVFFIDTLKFFLSLYGHKLPVVCMDISSDSTLIVTGSADRNIKIWGLDFGDCHKSLFAHDDSVTCIQFVPKTHLFFSAGKDRKVKQWDADNFENVLTLEGHHGEVRCLAVSPSGNTTVTASQDRSIRLWEKTEEPLVLEEEREMEREKEEAETLLQNGEEVVPGETTEEVKMAGKKSIETIKGTERIMEAIDIYETQVEAIETALSKKANPPAPHPMMAAYQCTSPADFVLETIRRIRASELLGALLSLPFSYVSKVLPVLDLCLTKQLETELVCKCLNFLLKIHHGEITSNPSHSPVIEKLKEHCVGAVHHQRDLTAFNAAGLSFLRKQVEESKSVLMFADATASRKKKKKRAVLVVK